jgi:hypothetical protein
LQAKVPSTWALLTKSVPEKVPVLSAPIEPDCLPVARAHGTPPARPCMAQAPSAALHRLC